MPGPGQTLSHDLRLTKAATPQMLLFLELMQKPALDLKARVEEEMVRNPALEEIPASETEAAEKAAEGEGDTFAGDPAEPPSDINYDPATEKPSGMPVDDLQAEVERLAQLDQEWREHFAGGNIPLRASEDEEEKRQFMFDSLVGATSLQEDLLEQMRMSGLSEEQQRVAESIIGNTDESGYLKATVDDLVFSSNFQADRVLEVLRVVQGFEPAGVGARDLQECLLLQLERCGREDTLEYRIVKEEMAALAKHRFPEIARRLGHSVSEVQAAAGQIAQLDPRPGRKVSTGAGEFVVPEVLVQRSNGEYAVTMRNEHRPRLRISRYFRALVGDPRYPEARDYIREKILAGSLFIRTLQQGQDTILSIAREIVKRQQGFMERGISGLKALMMAEVAQAVGVDESVVSRAVSGKYMDTPQGVIGMRYFFTSGLGTESGEVLSNESVKETISEMFGKESPEHPLSDQAVVTALNSQGIKIARRTVTKYREELGILPSNLRRSF